MKKTLNLILAFLCFFMSSRAEKPYIEVMGEQGKFLIFNQMKYPGKCMVEALSDNGKYICGGLTYNEKGVATVGWLYDIEKDSISYYEVGGFIDVTEDGICVTQRKIFNPKTGKSIDVEVKAPYDMATINGISGDGKTIVGYMGVGEYSAWPAVWGADGKFKKHPKTLWLGQQQPSGGVNRDGSIYAGRGDWRSEGKQISPYSPMLWTHGGDSVYHIVDTNMTLWQDWNKPGTFQPYGYFLQMGPSGIATGTSNHKAMLYTKEKGKTMLSAPSQWEKASFVGASETGYAVGYYETILAGFNRHCIVWNEKMGAVSLVDFAKNLYGVDASGFNLWFTEDMSLDGKIILGSAYTTAGYRPFMFIFKDKMLNSPAKNILAKQEKGTLFVDIEWEKPIYNQKEVLGYNIYFDDEKLNTQALQDLTYRHTAKSGIHKYAVEVVYSDGLSPKAFSKELRIIGIGSCPVNEYFANNTVYNRRVIMNWDMPGVHLHTAKELKEELQKSPSPLALEASVQKLEEDSFMVNTPPASSKKEGVQNLNAHFDLLDMHNLPLQQTYGICRIGDYYYTTNLANTAIGKWDLSWKLVDNFVVDGVQKSTTITTDGEYLYLGEWQKAPYITQVDVDEKIMLRQFKVADLPQNTGISHLCYNPSLDNGKGGFEVGRASSSIYIDRDGKKLKDGLTLRMASGTAYYKGYYLVAQQTQDIENANFCQIHVYDEKTGLPTGEYIELADFSEVNLRFTSLVSGGLSVYKTIDSIEVVGIVVQNPDGINGVVELDLFGSPEIAGYNLFRNDLKLNKEPLPTRRFDDTIFRAGNYVYRVEPVFTKGCDAGEFITHSVQIDSIHPCPAVRDLSAVEAAENVVLNWLLPETYMQAPLWFNVYRDGTKLNDIGLSSGRFSDIRPGNGQYTYKIETFFSNSCSSFDSIRIDVNDIGVCQAVNSLTASYKKIGDNNFEALLKWELPFRTELFPLRWGNGSMNSRAFGFPPQLAAMIGWERPQLDFYQGYNLVGIEFFINDECTVAPLVMIDDNIMLRGLQKRAEVGQFNRIMFPRPFSMDSCSKYIAVGYVCEMEEDRYPFVTDRGPAVVSYGDVVSIDPALEEWGTLAMNMGVDGNWMLAGLISKPRHLDGEETAHAEEEIIKINLSPNWKPRKMEETKKIRFPSAPNQYASSAPKAEELKLKGFNVYRDEEKMNTEILRVRSFSDPGLKLSEGKKYKYTVSSVWESCDELHSEPVYLNVLTAEESEHYGISIYPNPAKSRLHIQGEYKSIRIIDMSGRIVKDKLVNQKQIDIHDLMNGMYILSIDLPSGERIMKKILVQQ